MFSLVSRSRSSKGHIPSCCSPAGSSTLGSERPKRGLPSFSCILEDEKSCREPSTFDPLLQRERKIESWIPSSVTMQHDESHTWILIRSVDLGKNDNVAIIWMMKPRSSDADGMQPQHFFSAGPPSGMCVGGTRFVVSYM